MGLKNQVQTQNQVSLVLRVMGLKNQRKLNNSSNNNNEAGDFFQLILFNSRKN